MNKFKNIFLGIVAVSLLTITSCENFLDEEMKTARNDAYFDTEEGLQSAVVSLYDYLTWTYTGEGYVTVTQLGTDEFTVGGDNSNHDWNDYTSNLSPAVVSINSNTTSAQYSWDNFYKHISVANTIIEKADAAASTPAKATEFKAQAAFVRAYSYFNLVQQYGRVVLKTTPSTGVERVFELSEKAPVLEQIITDFEYAYNNLPTTEAAAGGEGYLYKDVAAHYLAKVHLYRASEINDDFNSSTKSSDLAKVITYADEVIANHPLAPDFADLWEFDAMENDENESLPEVIFAAQFSNSITTRGNRFHLYFGAQYNNLVGFFRDISGGREYQRFKTTNYSYAIFDLVNDSRAWKSFRTKYSLNDVADFPSINYDDVTYELGDLGLIYIINQPGDTRFTNPPTFYDDNHTGARFVDTATGKAVPHTYVRYWADGTDHVFSQGIYNRFPAVSKYFDGSRPTVAEQGGSRDGILARSAETYLLKAEALIRQENYPQAIDVINIVRARAQYKEGERREKHTDGGAAYAVNAEGILAVGSIERDAYCPLNSYYESLLIPYTTAATNITTGITPTALPAEDEAIIADLGYTSTYDRMLCFLLNERSRELIGEMHRWYDLARTETLVERAQEYNWSGGPNIRDYHLLRPIPQTFLDNIYTADGHALTADEKRALQNPGY